MIATSVIDGSSESTGPVTLNLYFPLNDNKDKKLLFMACNILKNPMNAITGCSGSISKSCTYPYYTKATINAFSDDPPLIVCYH